MQKQINSTQTKTKTKTNNQIVQSNVIDGKRPEITIHSKSDAKIRFLGELIETSWQQLPGNRPNPKQITIALREMMKQESKNPTQTPILWHD